MSQKEENPSNQKNFVDHYFDEWWTRNVKGYVVQKSGAWIDDYYPATGTIQVRKIGEFGPRMEPAPLYLKEWVELNPRPGIGRDAFIVALAKRVEALEAVLAEKGGAL